MPRRRSALRNWSEYLGARLAVMGLTLFDVQDNLRTASAIGRSIHRIDARHRERTLAHLAIAFPELSAARRAHLAIESFEHLFQLLVEIVHLPRLLHRDSWPRRLRLGNLGPAIELLNAGRPVIMLTGHVGNWEVLGYLMALLGYPMDAIARPLDNPLLYRWLLGIRERRGLRVITKWDATERMRQVLGGGGALGFIADQNAGDKGLFVPFFGRLASTYKSIGLLAVSQNVPIICGYARRFSALYEYELGATDIIHPHEWASRKDPLFYVTARYVRAMETMVRQNPAQYLWMHRRWKSRPRFEREGKEMPTALRENLESLPWMTQDLLDRLVNSRHFESA